MAVDGVVAEDEALRDVVVGETLGDEAENLQFALAETAERGIHRLSPKRRTPFAGLPEHGLGARALPDRAQFLEAHERRLDLAPCPIMVALRAQRGGDVEPHASRFEPGI